MAAQPIIINDFSYKPADFLVDSEKTTLLGQFLEVCCQ